MDRKDTTEGERGLLAKIAELPPNYRSLGESIHRIILVNGPNLEPRTWYGMPAYAKEGKVICFFRGGSVEHPERYMTLGFTEAAKTDEGRMWATSYALTELTAVEEERIAELVRMASR